jgi:hypothetical protein
LYNISKVARGAVLPFFNQIFDGLSKVSINFTCCLFTTYCLWKENQVLTVFVICS